MADLLVNLPTGLPADPTLLATLLDLLPMGVAYYTPLNDAAGTVADLTLAYLNPAAQGMLRQPAQPSATFRQQFPATTDNGSWAFHRDALLADTPQHFALNYQADGLDNYFRLTAQRLGEGLLVFFTDTSAEERSAVEQALRESQAREQAARTEAERQRGELQRVFEQAPIAIAVYRGPQYIIELANRTVATLWGRTPEQIVGLGLFEALPEVAGMGYEELLDGVMATGIPHVAHAMEAVHEREGRRDTVYWDFVYVPMYADDGSIYGAMVVANEVTEQVLARQQMQQLNQELEIRVAERTRQLLEQQLLLGRILAQVPASMASLSGPEHRFSFFNEPYQRLSADRARLGLTVAEVFPEIAEQGFIDLLDQVYATGQPFIGTDMPAQLFDRTTGRPEECFVDFIYQPLTNEQGHTEGVLAFIVDVTERMRARQQVQTLNEELAAINEEMRVTNEELNDTNTRLTRTNVDLDTFVYTASHDLKAPIMNVAGLLTLLRQQLPAPVATDPDVAQVLGLMNGAIERFQQTLVHLTDVSRLQAFDNQAPEAVDVPALVEDIRLDLAPLLARSGASLTVDVEQCAHLHFSAKNLRAIIANLLSNAVKYHVSGRPPVVHLRCYCPSPGYASLEVRDNGLGLDDTQRAKLFRLFQRLHTHVEGTGVGLHMVKRIVDNAGGTITVESESGVGSTFTVTLPN